MDIKNQISQKAKSLGFSKEQAIACLEKRYNVTHRNQMTDHQIKDLDDYLGFLMALKAFINPNWGSNKATFADKLKIRYKRESEEIEKHHSAIVERHQLGDCPVAIASWLVNQKRVKASVSTIRNFLGSLQ